MRFPRFLSAILFIAAIVISASAQTPTDEQKLKQKRQVELLEQVLADVQNLRLGENRALIYAQVGNLFWNSDQKRARTLFQNSITELINAQMFAEGDKKNAPMLWDLLNSQSLRPNLLQIIANRDAEFALTNLLKSRPSKIVKAIANYSAKSDKVSDANYSQDSQFAQNELNLEQRLTALAAEQNPERAVKLLKESLQKNITQETLGLLNKVHQKDPETADELASEILRKLAKADYDPINAARSQNYSVAVSLLNEFIRDKSADEKFLRLDENQIRGLADVVISATIKTPDRNNWYIFSSLLPIAQKLAASKVESIRKKLADYNRQNQYGYSPEASELLQSDASAEKLISQADKFSPNYKQQIYAKAANKYVEQGNIEQAKSVLSENLSDEELENALSSFNWQLAMRNINEEKFDAAIIYINQLPESARVNSLLHLANTIYQKNPAENKSYAAAILEQARALISERPEDANEMSALFQIITGYATIEPTEAFRLFEPLIPQINELSEASVIINGFTKNSNVRQGEFTLSNGNQFGLYMGEVDSALQSLAKTDFERTAKTIDGFQRRETRIVLRMKLAETALM